jgi:phosphotriesterase-related protein
MPTVQSVAGPLDTGELGFTLMHEHVVSRTHGLEENFGLWDRAAELANAISEAEAAMARGVRTIVDQTPADWRDVPFVQDVVRATGLQVIVATGVYYDVPYYFRSRSADHAAGLFVRDLERGIADTGVRAAFIKCATHMAVNEHTEKMLRAAAMAHRATGAPISTHSECEVQGGLAQQAIFREEGVDLSRVLIGHCGDSDDLDYLRRVLDAGSFIGMDRFGLDRRLPTDRRVATIGKLCEFGYAGQLTLSHDHSAYFWVDRTGALRDNPDWHWNFVPDAVVPALRRAGVAEEHVRAMTVDNPRRFFEEQGAY